MALRPNPKETVTATTLANCRPSPRVHNTSPDSTTGNIPGRKTIRHVDSLQPPFSLIRRQAAANETPWCARHNTGVICYSSMQSGLLTDTFSRKHVARFGEDDWRRSSPDFSEPNLSRNLALRDALRPIAQRHRATVAVVAVRLLAAVPSFGS